MRQARLPSRVHTPAPRPYFVSLAIRSASASSVNVVSASTGPKISSWKTRIEFSPLKIGGGYYYQPTILHGEHSLRAFQEEICGPVLALTTFTDEADALRIANDTKYGLGAGVWTRDGNRAYRMGRGIQAGRVWTNCYHNYPAGAAFGGYKMSG